MHQDVIIPAVIASLTTGHILFLAVYLWLHTARHLPNRLLSVLLFCYALRVIKSVLLLVFPGAPFSGLLIALGVIGMSAIGPLLLFYVRSLLTENFNLQRNHYVHFLPTALLAPVAFFVPEPAMFYVYQFTVYQILAYLIASFVYAKKLKPKAASPAAYGWLTEIFIAVSFLWVVFCIQLYVRNEAVYTAVSLSAAAVFYAISLRAAFRKDVFYPVIRKKNKVRQQNLLPRIEAKLESEKLYLDSLLTVNKLAAALKLPAHVVSAAINDEAGMGFSEFLNAYRVREATEKLRSKKYESLSIEAVAYDCGFNSLSAFYNAFKRVHKTTPAKFRQQTFPDSEIRKPLS